MRAVSTVVDVTVCLLLVSAAVAALAVQPVETPAVGADETAESLGRTTANVSFRIGTGDGVPRRVSSTHAGLLGRAALADLELDGRDLAPAADDFGAAVENETERVLAWSRKRTSVTAVWEPYPGAPLGGRVKVGASPPAGVDVATARLRAPVPVDDVRTEARAATDGGFEAVGGVVAASLLDVTLPHDGIEAPDPASRAGDVTRRRLRAYEAALGLEADGAGVETRVRRIESTLAGHLAADMRKRFASPGDAAAAVRTGTVRVVVREWSP